MTLIALDLGRIVGVAYGHPDSEPELTHWRLPKALGHQLFEFEAKLRGLLTREGVAAVGYEEPLMPFGVVRANLRTNFQQQFGQQGIIEKICHSAIVPAKCWQPRTLKAKIIGSAKADKGAVIQFAKGNGLEPLNDHEADAYMIWRHAAAHFYPRDLERVA